MSLIAWLDVSAEEQRRVRELVAMFADKSTLDELGVGQIRDGFSDTMFPGLSTIQTRARYFVFVPWAYRLAAERAPRAKVPARAEAYERHTVIALRNAHAGQGIVGAVAGAQVKNLPSALYWGGLTEFGILAVRSPVSRSARRGPPAWTLTSSPSVSLVSGRRLCRAGRRGSRTRCRRGSTCHPTRPGGSASGS